MGLFSRWWGQEAKFAERAAVLLVACEKRLVSDEVLVEMCGAWGRDAEEYAWGRRFLVPCPPNRLRSACDAVEAELARIRLRIAEANYKAAKEAVEGP